MDKRGFIRTLEAVIAVIVVFVFIYSVGRGGYESTREVDSIKSLQESILSEISKNDALRECIVNTPPNQLKNIEKDGSRCGEVDTFIKESLPPRFLKKYRFNVCDPKNLGEGCQPPDFRDSTRVYTSAVIITSSLKGDGTGTYSPRILRLWFF
tara:strand:- start:3132 stop:3590 length:459 start_codon:yes stop_codon:yes gene_type:complete